MVQIMPADAPNHLLIGCDELLKGGYVALLRAPENEFIHCRSLLVFHDERLGDFVPCFMKIYNFSSAKIEERLQFHHSMGGWMPSSRKKSPRTYHDFVQRGT